MKKTMFILSIFMLFSWIGSELMAQPARNRQTRMAPAEFNRPYRQTDRTPAMSCLQIENLSEEQQEALKAIHLKRTESSLIHRNEMDALRAEKRAHMLKAEPDMAEVNKLIDEMSAKRAEWMKQGASQRQEIRRQLTEEQRIQYDSRSMRRQGNYGQGRASQAPRGRRAGW